MVFRRTFLLICFLIAFASQLVAKQDFASHIHYDPDGPNRIGYLKLEKERPIDSSTYLYVKFALEHFKKEKVCFVLLHLDTPGGEVLSSMKIADLFLKLDAEDRIPVVAFIDNWAISAGAMLAYASRYIGIVPSASMGAAEPVLSGEDGKMQTASEKINSALRAEFANLAHTYERDPLIAEGMVDKDRLLVWRNGRALVLEGDAKPRSSDLILAPRGKLLTLNGKQLLELGLADFSVQPIPLPSGPFEEGKVPFSSSLLSHAPFFEAIPQATLLSYHNWKIDFFSFLSHPLISSLLMMGLMIGLYLEVSHPGFGAPGILALLCLGLILLSSFALQTIHLLEVILLGAGILLLLIEIFILPGFGIAGVLGILLTLAGLFGLLLPSASGVEFSWNGEEWNLATVDFIHRLSYLVGAFLLSLVVIAVIGRWVTPRLMRLSKMVLTDDQEGYLASTFETAEIGKTAYAATELKPSGYISVEGKLLQALSESGYIAKGEEVKIIGGKGAYLIVRHHGTPLS